MLTLLDTGREVWCVMTTLLDSAALYCLSIEILFAFRQRFDTFQLVHLLNIDGSNSPLQKEAHQPQAKISSNLFSSFLSESVYDRYLYWTLSRIRYKSNH